MIARVRRLPTWVLSAALAAAYFALGRLGLSLAVVNPSASAVWPPTGLALAACLVLGYRVWPGIFAGAFLVNLTTNGSLPVSLAIAAGNTLEALAGAWLVNRFTRGRPYFDTAADTLAIAGLAALGATLIAATLGTASLVLGGLAAPADFGPIWLTWWLGDASGALIVAPPLILWAQPPRTPGKPGRALEAILMLLALAGLGLLVFGGLAPLSGRHLPLEFLILPLVTWAAFRFGRRGAAGATLVLAGIAVWGTYRGYGPFSLGAPADSLLLLQACMATIARTDMGEASVVVERRQSELSLRLSRDELAVILQGAADGVIAQDAQGKIHYANDAAARLLGFPSGAALLAAPRTNHLARFAVYDEAGRPMPAGQLPGRVALRDGRHAAATVRYVDTATGAERWSADQATPILGDDGQVRLVINILHDITDLKRTELHQRLLAEAGRMLVAPLDPEAQLGAVAELLVPHLADWCVLQLIAEDGTLR